jgi:hypothetical protein
MDNAQGQNQLKNCCEKGIAPWIKW